MICTYKILRNSLKQLLELINKFCKCIEYKINIQKLVVSLYTSNKQSENKTKKAIPFVIVSKTIKYLEKDLMKEVSRLVP